LFECTGVKKEQDYDCREHLEGRNEACGVRLMEISRLWILVAGVAIAVAAVLQSWSTAQFDEPSRLTNDVKHANELEQVLLLLKEEDTAFPAVKGK